MNKLYIIPHLKGKIKVEEENRTMEEKIKKLKGILKNLQNVIVSYSGGVDSSFLLEVAVETIGKENVIAVIGISDIFTKEEKDFAEKFCASCGVRYIKIKTNQLQNKNFIKNLPDRCFWCKKELFEKMEKIRRKNKFNYIIDGTNKNDENDYRPGEKAKKIFNVLSPLKEVDITKEEIRKYSKKIGLPTWNKPQMSCLATRIPYGEKITREKLKRIEEGEKFLISLGFKIVRIREHEEIARIEVDKQKIEKLVKMREKIAKKLKTLGYKYITVDLDGYRSGSMNEVIKISNRAG